MSTKYFLVLLVVLVGMVGFGYIDKTSNQVGTASAVEQKNNQSEPVIKTMGVVEVEAIPTKLIPGVSGTIQLNFNNHSVDLDYDFESIAKISDDLGNEYPVSEWTGGKGGHHQSGELKFGNIHSKATSINLILSGIDGESDEFSFSI